MRKSRFSEPQIVHILRQADVGEKTIGQLLGFLDPTHFDRKEFPENRCSIGGSSQYLEYGHRDDERLG